MKKTPKLMPKRAMIYNDVAINCPFCHKPIIIFEGSEKNHKCPECGAVIKDRIYRMNTIAYKNAKIRKD